MNQPYNPTLEPCENFAETQIPFNLVEDGRALFFLCEPCHLTQAWNWFSEERGHSLLALTLNLSHVTGA